MAERKDTGETNAAGAMAGLTEGRIVHYVLPDGPNAGEHRPAIVVHVWRGLDGKPPDNGCCQLAVFMDGANDRSDYHRSVDGTDDLSAPGGMVRWATSVVYAESPDPYTWHWIEKA